MMGPRMERRNSRQLWILAGVTYGLVIATTIFAVWIYFHLAAKSQQNQNRSKHPERVISP